MLYNLFGGVKSMPITKVNKIIIILILMIISLISVVWVAEDYGIIGKSKEEWAAYHACGSVEDFYMQLEPTQVKYYKIESICQNSFLVHVNIYILENWDYKYFGSLTVDASFKGGAISDENNWVIDW